MASESLLLESLDIFGTEDGDVLYTEGAESAPDTAAADATGPLVTIYPAIRSSFLLGEVGMLTGGMELSIQILDVVESEGIGLYNEDDVFFSDISIGSLIADPVPLTGLGWSAMWDDPVTIAEVTSSEVVVIAPLDPPAGIYGAAVLVFWTGDPADSRLVAYWNLMSNDSSLNVPDGTFVRIGWDDPNLGNRVFTI